MTVVPHSRPRATHAWLAVACAVAFAGVAVLVATGVTAPIDESIHAWAASVRHDVPVGASHVLAVAGGTWGAIGMIAVLTLVLALTRHGRAAIALPIATTLGWLAMAGIKALLERARPLDRLDDIGGWSFPSGHATCAAAIAVVLLVGVRAAWVRALAIVWIVAMPVSRVLLGVHWPSDVLGGVLLGSAIALATTAVVAAIAQRRSTSLETDDGTAMPARRSGAASGAS